MRLLFVLPDSHRHDEYNLITGIKALKDTLVETRIVRDDDFTHLEAEYGCEVDAERGPAMVIEIVGR